MSTVDVTTLFWISHSPTTVIPVSTFFYNFRFAIRLVSNPLSSASGGVTQFLLFFSPTDFPANKGGAQSPCLAPFHYFLPITWQHEYMRAGFAGESVFSAHLAIRLAHRNSANAARWAGRAPKPFRRYVERSPNTVLCSLGRTLPASMWRRTGQMNELCVMVRPRLEYYLDAPTTFPLAGT